MFFAFQIKIGHIEYSGFQNGKRVMGLAMFDQLMRKINPDNILNWTVPVGWNLEDAATVLLAYSTVSLLVYYLIILNTVYWSSLFET